MKNRPRALRITLLTALLVVGYTAGYISHATVRAQDAGHAYPQLATFARVLAHIERAYVDPVDDQRMLYSATKAMVSSLDPHSNFMTPEEFAAMREDTSGEYVGVGMELGVRDEKITVITPFEGGPAFEAGISGGDILIEIDGEWVTDRSVEEVVHILRGEQGDPVHILVHRAIPDTEDYDVIGFDLVRDVIHIPAVDSRLLAPGYGYISVSSFQAGVTNEVRNALDQLHVANEGELDGVVLDLRNNPGGLLSESISMSDLFLDDGLVVTTEGRDPEENEEFHSRNGNTAVRAPLVGLVNGGSASASEILAGAIRDRSRGTIIGTTTFGKGTVQSIIDFDDGSGLKLTTARYFTPNHISIHGDGIEPDVHVPADTVAPVFTADGFEPIIDRQLEVALEELRNTHGE